MAPPSSAPLGLPRPGFVALDRPRGIGTCCGVGAIGCLKTTPQFPAPHDKSGLALTNAGEGFRDGETSMRQQLQTKMLLSQFLGAVDARAAGIACIILIVSV